MKLLLIADTTPRLPAPLPQYVADNGIDAVITAGDLYAKSLDGIGECHIPAMGVYGNHCDGTYLDDLGMHNLHRNRVEISGVSFVGIEGCVRYKDSTQSIMYTQAEYAAMLAGVLRADVIVTHCPPRGINDHADRPHVGIDALLSWVREHQPRVLIHGHTYPQVPITAFGSTRIVYVHGARTITI